MKDCTFKLEFLTHCLANGMSTKDDHDCFQRDGANRLVFQQSWWFSSFSKAIELAHIRGIKAADIHMDLSVDAPTQLYRRKYGDDKYRVHEAIMPGTTVTFEAVVAEHVTESNMRRILERMGKFVGLSPYGYNLGFGKFNVVDVKVANSEQGTAEASPRNS